MAGQMLVDTQVIKCIVPDVLDVVPGRKLSVANFQSTLIVFACFILAYCSVVVTNVSALFPAAGSSRSCGSTVRSPMNWR